jgi:hypothetical protein
MKPILQLFLFAALAIVLSACPYSSAYKLDAEPLQPIDENLLGKWAAFVKKPQSGKEEPVKIIFTKKTETIYNIAITGYIDELRPYIHFAADSIKGEAFLSLVENKPLLNVFIRSRNYLCEVQAQKGKLSLLPLSEHFTAKLVKSNEVLRTALEFHYKTHLQPVYDEEFCLKDMVRVN